MTYLARSSAVEIEDLDLSGSDIEFDPTLSETTPPSASVPERILDRVERVTGYDYGAIESHVAEEAELIADRVRERMRANIIETGNDLLAIKEKLRHGHFLPWIKFHFGWSERIIGRVAAYLTCLVDERTAIVAGRGSSANIEEAITGLVSNIGISLARRRLVGFFGLILDAVIKMSSTKPVRVEMTACTTKP